MRGWRNVGNYNYTINFTAEQWAWEFLRRNPCYRSEWRAFHRVWTELEETYGKPSQRDIAAWKQDQRAWVPAAECQASDCKVDGDKVLIECALGARWGFYKFPPDPVDDDPVGGGRLVWREITVEPTIVQGDVAVSEIAPESCMLNFDLSLPLRDQLVSAKRQLQIEQRNRVQACIIRAPRIAAHRERLCRMLRLLDALEAEAGAEQIQAILYSKSNNSYSGECDEAILLRDHEYRRLLLLD